ncbi:MAG: sigma-70 family RNA polymerase sigma factor [Phycisphaerales bacterium]|nr:sigma-70 family RNA polymerase sigma factor [Phycisphaerales bacterium]
MTDSRCTPTLRSDEELARRAQAGSVAAFARLVSIYQGRLYNFLLRRTGSTADAEDLTQETLVRAWRHIGRYHPGRSFSTWVFTIAGRLAATHQRDEAVRRKHENDPGAHRAQMCGLADDRLDRHEQHRAIWDAAEHVLTPVQHAVLWLRYAEDMPAKDIAHIVGRSQIAVRVMLHRTLERLAGELSRPDDKASGEGVSGERQHRTVMRRQELTGAPDRVAAPREAVRGGT